MKEGVAIPQHHLLILMQGENMRAILAPLLVNHDLCRMAIGAHVLEVVAAEALADIDDSVLQATIGSRHDRLSVERAK